MSLSLQNQANERRSRIAALRKKTKSRNSDQNTNAGIDLEEQNSEVQINKLQTNLAVDNSGSGINDSSGKYTVAQNIDYQDTISEDSAPRLQINNLETVEVIAGKIQLEIFEKLRQDASQAISNPPSSVPIEKFVNNSDLKSQLEPYLKKANSRTQKAINRIIQQKYDEQNATQP